MAKASKKTPESGNGGSGQPKQKQQQANQPMLNVLAQYIKDFSFENPNAPNSLRPREKSPEINIDVNVNTNGMGDDNYEVELHMEAKASSDGELVFNAELKYAGIFRLQGIPEQTIQAALLIECPRILFPFARQIIADSTRNGGFPPLLIDPIDFSRLYQARISRQSQAQQTN